MTIDYKKIIIFWLIPLFFLSVWYLHQIILPFLVGIFWGVVVQTLSLFLSNKLKINYYLNVFFIYFLFILIFSLIFYLTFKVMIEQVPSLLEKVNPYLKQFNLKSLDLKFQDFLTINNDYMNYAFKILYNFFGGIFSFLLIFVISLYTALNKNFPQGISPLFKNEEKYFRLWEKIKRKISFWFLGQIILMLFIGVSTYIFTGLILKVNYAPFISLMAGILEIVPVIGPIISLIVSAVIVYLDEPESVFYLILFFIILQQIENHFLVPIIMKKAIALDPLLIILGVLIGGKIAGILGVIVVLPILGAVEEILVYAFKSFKSKNKTSSE